MERAANNLAHELSECAAFLLLVSESSKETDAEVSEHYAGFSAYMNQMATDITSEKLAQARLELSLKSMMKETDYSYANMSILSNEFLEPCAEMSGDIGTRLQYWLDKED